MTGGAESLGGLGSGSAPCVDGPDADGDGVSDECDECPGHDDNDRKVIQGHVTIPTMADFDQMAGVGEVTGELAIGYYDIESDITSLESLTCLQTVGELGFRYNDQLTSLLGLEGVSFGGGGLIVFSNAALTSLEGLEGITAVNGHLSVRENPALTSLTGLEGLTTINGTAYIQSNHALTSLAGLSNVSTVESLFIVANDSLTDLLGLQNLTTVLGNLDIRANEGLTNLTGLDNVTLVQDSLDIAGNTLLTSLSGLASVNTVAERLRIANHPLLSRCAINAWVDSLESHGELDITTGNFDDTPCP